MESLYFRLPPSTLFCRSATNSRHRSAATSRLSGPAEAPMHTSSRPFTPSRPPLRLWPPEDDDEEQHRQQQPPPRRSWRGSWIMKILRVRFMWEKRSGGHFAEEDDEEEREQETIGDLSDEGDRSDRSCCSCEEGEDGCCCVDDDGDRVEVDINRDVFSNFLRKASLAEAEFYAKMSYLGCLAYAIPKIKPAHLLKTHGLRFVTSSLERKMSGSDEKEKQPIEEKEAHNERVGDESKLVGDGANRLSASGVYSVVASAASYVHSQTRTLLPFGQVKDDGQRAGLAEEGDVCARLVNSGSLEEASFVVTSESVTAVVAAKEEVKEAVAKDLNSSQASPCEWFICDDDRTATRYFVIQGSETLTSWQANLLFEPIQFEGMDVLVHRGIYEAAKGMYKQMLPEIKAHLETCGSRAKLSFTGHSLGGSLSLLINLMLLIRGEAPASALLPVITFGAPSILCGGNALLQRLGLPRNHLQAITLHRDIVPRAFSCTYPDRVADILKAVNWNFRNHPCLKNQNLLYSPMGEILILQPEESFSPNHHLLPSGSGLYFLANPLSDDADGSRKLLRAAFSVFLNNPHPLEILSDRSAYGAGGTVIRDHDMNSYLISIRAVIREERKILKVQRRHRAIWPPLITRDGLKLRQLDISVVLQEVKEPLKRLRRIAGSENSHLILLLLLPLRALVATLV